jgi:SNF family Na+-dependent transporter
MNKKRSHFSGKIGFVLAAAGASVGLGNIWRFPYLAAKYGGGAFLLVYIILAFVFGYTMIVSETVIGRISKRSPIGAFQAFSDKKIYHVGGWINAIIPMLIVPYYSTIGGWVLNYLFQYIIGNTDAVAQDSYFGSFISDGFQTELWFVVFALCALVVVFLGVRNGIERVSKLMMPILVVLSLIIAIYSMTRPGAIAGIVSGTIVSLFWMIFVFKKTAVGLGICKFIFGVETLLPAAPWPFIDVMLIAVPVSAVLTIVVSLLTKPPAEEVVDKAFSKIDPKGSDA